MSLSLPLDHIVDLADGLESLFALLPTPYIVCTDANGHHPQWDFPPDNSRGALIHNWIASKSLDLQKTVKLILRPIKVASLARILP